MAAYTPKSLYEDAFGIKFYWEKHLDAKLYRYHDLVRRQMSTPIELQMGTILPFIASCLGPRTRGLFFTEPSVLNIFWMNVAASGVGKSQSRKKFVSDPLQYILSNSSTPLQDFEVCSFTRAGEYNVSSCVWGLITDTLTADKGNLSIHIVGRHVNIPCTRTIY